ncbi:MAG: hypothetical protein NT027_00215, partial [Proteobacteria bacterium]|nr:hypothetical protein [Pseudomonadota bacterium]
MKNLLLAAVCFGSSMVNASESDNLVSGINVVKVERSASAMQVKSVEIKTSNLGRGLGFNVFAVVEFGNSCMVPKSSEVVMSFLMGQGFDDVSYSLISL